MISVITSVIKEKKDQYLTSINQILSLIHVAPWPEAASDNRWHQTVCPSLLGIKQKKKRNSLTITACGGKLLAFVPKSWKVIHSCKVRICYTCYTLWNNLTCVVCLVDLFSHILPNTPPSETCDFNHSKAPFHWLCYWHHTLWSCVSVV